MLKSRFRLQKAEVVPQTECLYSGVSEGVSLEDNPFSSVQSAQKAESSSVILIQQLRETKGPKCGLQEFDLVLDSTEEYVIFQSSLKNKMLRKSFNLDGTLS